MTWYFIYYSDARFSHSFIDIKSYFNQSVIATICSDTVFHEPDSHKLHGIGHHLKNYGLRSALILQTADDNEGLMLQLMGNDVINKISNQYHTPVLQLILRDPDFARLAQACMPLDLIRVEQAQSRDDMQVSNNIQRISLRLVRTVEELGTRVSPAFVTAADVFVGECNSELERIHLAGRAIAKKAAVERKKILAELLSYSTFTLVPDLK